MNQNSLRRFAPLYWNANWYGAAKSLRTFLDLPAEYVIPLALPHGVDFGHVKPVQDMLAVEPIHWAHNDHIAQAVAPFKPALAIPHPFLLELAQIEPVEREGILVVGPPPGPVNDQRLLARLGKVDPQTTILVKPKPGYEHSMAFWRDHGFRTATLSDFGPANYETMARLLIRTRQVIGCTFSSLVVFAAAAGAQVRLLRDYRYDCFDLVEQNSSYEVIDWQSQRAAGIVSAFTSETPDSVTALARTILGGDLDADVAVLRSALDEAIRQLAEPIYWRRPHLGITRRIAGELAVRLRRPGTLRFNTRRWLWRHVRPTVWAREMDEIGLWLDGRTGQTLIERQIPFISGRTEPGDAVRQYGSHERATFEFVEDNAH